jgi:integration host factor subunit alpha
MTLTKADIVKKVMEEVCFKRQHEEAQQFLFPELDRVFLGRSRTTEIVDTLLEKIKGSLAKGKDVNIQGFGKFRVKFKWARKGRNPQTGESMILRSRRTVTFRCSPKLREKINSPDQFNDSKTI